jgi:hypothetical protein
VRTRFLWPLTTSILTAVVGGLLMAVPFGLEYQPPGAPWTAATQATLWAGIVLAGLSLIVTGLWVGQWAAAQGKVPTASAPPEHAAQWVPASGTPPHPLSPEEDPAVSDAALRALAAAVLRDLQSSSGPPA